MQPDSLEKSFSRQLTEQLAKLKNDRFDAVDNSGSVIGTQMLGANCR